jgi:hypothetical protein
MMPAWVPWWWTLQRRRWTTQIDDLHWTTVVARKVATEAEACTAEPKGAVSTDTLGGEMTHPRHRPPNLPKRSKECSWNSSPRRHDRPKEEQHNPLAPGEGAANNRLSKRCGRRAGRERGREGDELSVL